MPESQKCIDEILTFWFGPLDASGSATPRAQERWRTKDPALDDEIRARFEPTYEAIVAGEHEDWPPRDDGLIAYLVVLDQFGRNMYRGTPKMYAADAQALRVALQAIDAGRDKTAIFAHRNFIYMPLMHAEDLALQDQCVALYTAWRDEVEGPQRTELTRRIGFAQRHRDAVARFGRYPHRNLILQRPSTPAELEFLTRPDAWF